VYAAFTNSEEFIGRDIIIPLTKINDKLDLKLFDFVCRFSEYSLVKGINCTDRRFDSNFIKSEVSKWENLQTVFVCGPPIMNRSVLKGLSDNKIDRDIVHLL